jgi:UDP-N-acetylmuramate--alanine ligase
MGIAGAGMAALAELLHRRGVHVTGCDASTDGAPDLTALGIAVSRGHDPAHLDRASGVVFSSAIPRDHPELTRAQAAGIPVVRRAEALAAAVAAGRVVGIAGTHGKTTTTVMTTEALAAAGHDPTGLVGGRVGTWGGNLRRGADRLFVVEADEYDRSFLALHPAVTVVTNLEADHLDIYRDLDDLRAAFTNFATRGRWIVLCADDPGANALPSPAGSEVLRYGIHSPDARLQARDVEATATGSRFRVRLDQKHLGEVRLRVPGAHNVRNALAAIAVGEALGASLDALRPGLEAFAGVERRFQRLGEVRGVAVVDDYAHHPTEVDATLAAAREAYPGRRLVVAFQPHLYTRTRDFAPAFGAALATADLVFLCEIYPAREQPLPGVSAGLIADALTAAGGHLAWRGPRAEVVDAVRGHLREGDVVLTMGAGDITRSGAELLARLVTAGA